VSALSILLSIAAAITAAATLGVPASAHIEAQHFINPDEISVVPSINPEQPYVTSVKPEQQPNRSPLVQLSPASIVNPGHPVLINVYGNGFSSFSLVTIEVHAPDGDGPIDSTTTYAQENGAFSQNFLWTPAIWLGTEGNNGGWPVTVIDRYSRLMTTVLLKITTASATPTISNWTDRNFYEQHLPISRLQVLVASEGSLCSSQADMSLVNVSGATPDGSVSIYYFNPDDEQIAMEGTAADDFGDIVAQPLAWTTQNCLPHLDLSYKVVAVDSATGAQAEGTLLLSTSPPP